MRLKKITIVLLVLFSNTSICQEIVFETASLKEKPNNIFQTNYSGYNRQKTYNRDSDVKVSDLKDHLIIDYTRRHYIYSFVFDQKMNLINETTKKLNDTSYPNFFESYGSLDNRIFVFQGFDKNKLYLVQANKEYEGTLFNIDKNEYVGSFVSSNVFYHLGYDKKNKELVFNWIDQTLNKKTKSLALSEFLKDFSEENLKLFDKVFSNSRFEEINPVQLNTIEEITRPNKFYVQNNQLILAINPKQENKEIYKTYLITTDLKSFSPSIKTYEIKVPEIIGKRKIRVSSYSNGKNFFSLLTKPQINSYLKDDKLFVLLGNTKGFLLSIFDEKTQEQLYLNLFDKDSFFDSNTNLLFDFEPSDPFINQNNVKKSIEKRLKIIFDLRAGLKVNTFNENYHLTIGGSGRLNGNSGGMISTIGTNSTNDIYNSSFDVEKSMSFILNKKSLDIENTNTIHNYQTIENFRKENFYKLKSTLGIKQYIPTKNIPRTEVQFKFGDSYFLAYYSDKEDQYIIRKFN